MIHEAPNVQAPAPNGFIGIEHAEQLRQSVTSAEFRRKYPEEYKRAVEASVALRRAEQELAGAKARIAELSTPVKTGDLYDAIERDARGMLKLDKAPQDAHPSVTKVSSPTGVDAKAGTKMRAASVKDVGQSSQMVATHEPVPSHD